MHPASGNAHHLGSFISWPEITWHQSPVQYVTYYMSEPAPLSSRLTCSFCRTIACCTDRTQERDRQAKAAARGKMLEYAKKAQNEVQQGIQSSPGKFAKPSKYIASSRESSLSSGVAGGTTGAQGACKGSGVVGVNSHIAWALRSGLRPPLLVRRVPVGRNALRCPSGLSLITYD